jgi:hypothetical protein
MDNTRTAVWQAGRLPYNGTTPPFNAISDSCWRAGAPPADRRAFEPRRPLFNRHQRPDRKFGEEFPRRYAREADTAMRGRIIRHHAFVHSEIKAA